MAPRTLYDKIWDDHVVATQPDGTSLLYIDRHLVHEVTSPAGPSRVCASPAARFGRRRRRCWSSTTTCRPPTAATASKIRNRRCRWRRSPRTPSISISNIMTSTTSVRASVTSSGPEQGFTLPGTTIVCGDSHTSTHGAFGALAHGIGTSEVEHVLATQTLVQAKAKNMRVVVDGVMPEGITAKDIVLAIVGELGTAGGTGYVIEYTGEGDPRPVDRRPHDRLQHVDRGGRPRRSDRSGREDLRLFRGQAEGAEGRRLGCRGPPIGRRCTPTKGAHFDAEIRLNAADLTPDRHLGHLAGRRRLDQRRGAEPGRHPG